MTASFPPALLWVFFCLKILSAESCCLRTDPAKSLSDGIYLQNILMSNHLQQNKDYWFVPNAPNLILNRVQEDLVKDLLTIIRQRKTWTHTNEVTLSEPIKKIYDVIVSDTCAYLSVVLDERVDCSTEYLEGLYRKLELKRIVKSIHRQFYNRDSTLFGSIGSSRNHYAYWNKYVKKACTPCTCPNVDEIERNVVNFASNSNICSCS